MKPDHAILLNWVIVEMMCELLDKEQAHLAEFAKLLRNRFGFLGLLVKWHGKRWTYLTLTRFNNKIRTPVHIKIGSKVEGPIT